MSEKEGSSRWELPRKGREIKEGRKIAQLSAVENIKVRNDKNAVGQLHPKGVLTPSL